MNPLKKKQNPLIIFSYLNSCRLSSKTKNNWWEPKESDNSAHHHHLSLHRLSVSLSLSLSRSCKSERISLELVKYSCQWVVCVFGWTVKSKIWAKFNGNMVIFLKQWGRLTMDYGVKINSRREVQFLCVLFN